MRRNETSPTPETPEIFRPDYRGCPRRVYRPAEFGLTDIERFDNAEFLRNLQYETAVPELDIVYDVNRPSSYAAAVAAYNALQAELESMSATDQRNEEIAARMESLRRRMASSQNENLMQFTDVDDAQASVSVAPLDPRTAARYADLRERLQASLGIPPCVTPEENDEAAATRAPPNTPRRYVSYPGRVYDACPYYTAEMMSAIQEAAAIPTETAVSSDYSDRGITDSDNSDRRIADSDELENDLAEFEELEQQQGADASLSWHTPPPTSSQIIQRVGQQQMLQHTVANQLQQIMATTPPIQPICEEAEVAATGSATRSPTRQQLLDESFQSPAGDFLPDVSAPSYDNDVLEVSQDQLGDISDVSLASCNPVEESFHVISPQLSPSSGQSSIFATPDQSLHIEVPVESTTELLGRFFDPETANRIQQFREDEALRVTPPQAQFAYGQLMNAPRRPAMRSQRAIDETQNPPHRRLVLRTPTQRERVRERCKTPPLAFRRKPPTQPRVIPAAERRRIFSRTRQRRPLVIPPLLPEEPEMYGDGFTNAAEEAAAQANENAVQANEEAAQAIEAAAQASEVAAQANEALQRFATDERQRAQESPPCTSAAARLRNERQNYLDRIAASQEQLSIELTPPFQPCEPHLSIASGSPHDQSLDEFLSIESEFTAGDDAISLNRPLSPNTARGRLEAAKRINALVTAQVEKIRTGVPKFLQTRRALTFNPPTLSGLAQIARNFRLQTSENVSAARLQRQSSQTRPPVRPRRLIRMPAVPDQEIMEAIEDTAGNVSYESPPTEPPVQQRLFRARSLPDPQIMELQENAAADVSYVSSEGEVFGTPEQYMSPAEVTPGTQAVEKLRRMRERLNAALQEGYIPPTECITPARPLRIPTITITPENAVCEDNIRPTHFTPQQVDLGPLTTADELIHNISEPSLHEQSIPSMDLQIEDIGTPELCEISASSGIDAESPMLSDTSGDYFGIGSLFASGTSPVFTGDAEEAAQAIEDVTQANEAAAQAMENAAQANEEAVQANEEAAEANDIAAQAIEVAAEATEIAAQANESLRRTCDVCEIPDDEDIDEFLELEAYATTEQEANTEWQTPTSTRPLTGLAAAKKRIMDRVTSRPYKKIIRIPTTENLTPIDEENFFECQSPLGDDYLGNVSSMSYHSNLSADTPPPLLPLPNVVDENDVADISDLTLDETCEPSFTAEMFVSSPQASPVSNQSFRTPPLPSTCPPEPEVLGPEQLLDAETAARYKQWQEQEALKVTPPGQQFPYRNVMNAPKRPGMRLQRAIDVTRNPPHRQLILRTPTQRERARDRCQTPPLAFRRRSLPSNAPPPAAPQRRRMRSRTRVSNVSVPSDLVICVGDVQNLPTIAGEASRANESVAQANVEAAQANVEAAQAIEEATQANEEAAQANEGAAQANAEVAKANEAVAQANQAVAQANETLQRRLGNDERSRLQDSPPCTSAVARIKNARQNYLDRGGQPQVAMELTPSLQPICGTNLSPGSAKSLNEFLELEAVLNAQPQASAPIISSQQPQREVMELTPVGAGASPHDRSLDEFLELESAVGAEAIPNQELAPITRSQPRLRLADAQALNEAILRQFYQLMAKSPKYKKTRKALSFSPPTPLHGLARIARSFEVQAWRRLMAAREQRDNTHRRPPVRSRPVRRMPAIPDQQIMEEMAEPQMQPAPLHRVQRVYQWPAMPDPEIMELADNTPGDVSYISSAGTTPECISPMQPQTTPGAMAEERLRQVRERISAVEESARIQRTPAVGVCDRSQQVSTEPAAMEAHIVTSAEISGEEIHDVSQPLLHDESIPVADIDIGDECSPELMDVSATSVIDMQSPIAAASGEVIQETISEQCTNENGETRTTREHVVIRRDADGNIITETTQTSEPRSTGPFQQTPVTAMSNERLLRGRKGRSTRLPLHSAVSPDREPVLSFPSSPINRLNELKRIMAADDPVSADCVSKSPEEHIDDLIDSIKRKLGSPLLLISPSSHHRPSPTEQLADVSMPSESSRILTSTPEVGSYMNENHLNDFAGLQWFQSPVCDENLENISPMSTPADGLSLGELSIVSEPSLQNISGVSVLEELDNVAQPSPSRIVSPGARRREQSPAEECAVHNDSYGPEMYIHTPLASPSQAQQQRIPTTTQPDLDQFESFGSERETTPARPIINVVPDSELREYERMRQLIITGVADAETRARFENTRQRIEEGIRTPGRICSPSRLERAPYRQRVRSRIAAFQDRERQRQLRQTIFAPGTGQPRVVSRLPPPGSFRTAVSSMQGPQLRPPFPQTSTVYRPMQGQQTLPYLTSRLPPPSTLAQARAALASQQLHAARMGPPSGFRQPTAARAARPTAARAARPTAQPRLGPRFRLPSGTRQIIAAPGRLPSQASQGPRMRAPWRPAGSARIPPPPPVIRRRVQTRETSRVRAPWRPAGSARIPTPPPLTRRRAQTRQASSQPMQGSRFRPPAVSQQANVPLGSQPGPCLIQPPGLQQTAAVRRRRLPDVRRRFDFDAMAREDAVNRLTALRNIAVNVEPIPEINMDDIVFEEPTVPTAYVNQQPARQQQDYRLPPSQLGIPSEAMLIQDNLANITPPSMEYFSFESPSDEMNITQFHTVPMNVSLPDENLTNISDQLLDDPTPEYQQAFEDLPNYAPFDVQIGLAERSAGENQGPCA